MKKKVLLVITKGNWGGAQRYVYDLALGLPKEAFAVAVALGDAGGRAGPGSRLAQQLREAGVVVYSSSAMQRDLSLLKDLASFLELYRLFAREQPDVVHLNSSKAGVLGALAARAAGVPRIIFTAHGWPFAEQRNFAWRTMAYLGSWLTALLAHAVICVSQADLARGRRLPLCAHKMRLVYNGINLAMPLSDGTIIRRAFPPGATITGTIGELNANKNHIALIEQARHTPGMYVAIVGEGELRDYLESTIKAYGLGERVQLFGFVPAAEVLKGFDVFALPSRKEGLPYVLLEARAAGLPIVANRVGGVGEILDATDLSQFSLEHMLAATAALYSS